MAVYKVPQDVEAEDKLIGPLSFRQFVYAIIAVMASAVAFFLFQLFALLAIIPVPVALLFGILALPLRKDQPMETYLLAILRFYLKPKMRRWNPDGTITYVEITAPKVIEQHLTKSFGGSMAKERLDYLASVMDTRGWALKGVSQPITPSVTADVAVEAQTAPDVLNENESLSRSFDTLLAKNDQARRQQAVEHMKQAGAQPATPPDLASTHDTGDTTALHYNPYPTAIHQKIVHPMGDTPPPTPTPPPAQSTATSAMTPKVSPDIMRLASYDGLSISAIAHEAHRLEEVVINLH